jgi:hypothetical protein
MKFYFKAISVGMILIATHGFANAMFSRTVDPLLKGTARHLRSIRPPLNLADAEARGFHATPRRSFPMGGVALWSSPRDDEIVSSSDVLDALKQKTKLPLAVKVLMEEPVIAALDDTASSDQPKNPSPPPAAKVTITVGGPIGC